MFLNTPESFSYVSNLNDKCGFAADAIKNHWRDVIESRDVDDACVN